MNMFNVNTDMSSKVADKFEMPTSQRTASIDSTTVQESASRQTVNKFDNINQDYSDEIDVYSPEYMANAYAQANNCTPQEARKILNSILGDPEVGEGGFIVGIDDNGNITNKSIKEYADKYCKGDAARAEMLLKSVYGDENGEGGLASIISDNTNALDD